MQDVGKLFEMAMELSRDEQIDLAERLWANASGPIDPDIEAAWKEEIARRIERLDQGQERTIPWEEVKRELDADPGNDM